MIFIYRDIIGQSDIFEDHDNILDWGEYFAN
jgi:hypothetical protein